MHAGTHHCVTDDLQWTKPWLVNVWHILYQIFKDAATNLNALVNALQGTARRMVRIFFLPYLGNRSKSDPCLYELFCLESHILSFPKVLQIPPKSPCMTIHC